MSDEPQEPLSDDTELLFRQVNPGFVRDGRIGSQAFRPTPKDQRMLSVARGALTTAEAAFVRHTECLKLSSAGTWAVTVGECAELGLPARPDEITTGVCPDSCACGDRFHRADQQQGGSARCAPGSARQ
jgi:hypothetical protein